MSVEQGAASDAATAIGGIALDGDSTDIAIGGNDIGVIDCCASLAAQERDADRSDGCTCEGGTIDTSAIFASGIDIDRDRAEARFECSTTDCCSTDCICSDLQVTSRKQVSSISDTIAAICRTSDRQG